MGYLPKKSLPESRLQKDLFVRIEDDKITNYFTKTLAVCFASEELHMSQSSHKRT